ncbi:MAG: baseplate protein J [Flavobacteriaceae bacterium]|nr:baseplate protein J [Flavobacteriaceae bacterium]|tara:strand:- start:33451 stop:36582 length:3132 start_codon:yes stop_codon:yes gene_type:complete
MAKNCDHTFLTQHLGTEQDNRSRNKVAPEKLRLNDFTIEDWMHFAYNFAEKLNYFDAEDHLNPDGDWTQFLVKKDKVASFLATHDGTGTMTPHLTLFVCFLKLLEYTQENFNSITKRHLDFYYGQVLQLEKKAPIADSVHLLFELAKNTQESLISKETIALGGKDALGKHRKYSTAQEAVINTAQIVSLKSSYHHRKGATAKTHEYNCFVAAPVVNSADGISEPFEAYEPWLPFGYPSYITEQPKLPTAEIGFAIGAPVLELQEGTRTITVTISLANPIETAILDITNNFSIYATGAEGWMGPLSVSNLSNGKNKNLPKTTSNLQFTLVLDGEQDAIVPYSKELHEGTFSDAVPMLKFELNIAQPSHANGYLLYTQLLENKIKDITVSVAVTDASSLVLSNDIGGIKADKPFYPFGTQPVEKNSLYVDYPEAFSKNWDTVTIQGDWLNQPEDFVQHYIAYRKKGGNKNLSPNQYYQVLYFQDHQTATGTNPNGTFAPTTVASNLYVSSNDHFKASIAVKKNGEFEQQHSSLSLFKKNGASFANGFTLQNASKDLEGPIEISLLQSFLHRVYPKVLALSMGSEQDTILPNEPYTPMAENLRLSYTASEKRTFNNKSQQANDGTITLHHLHPFGHAVNNQTLVPTYCSGGALYIGLSGTKKLQQVQLLVQLLEGTENPEVYSFSSNDKITWSYLSDNKWISFSRDYFRGDTTDNFLQTGIVSFIVPPEATQNNTLLPSGLVWIKATNPKRFDTVCKCIHIQAQVITATFVDIGNELSHLKTGLPAESITKLEQRNPLVKKVTQPFASFGGSAQEADEAFYQRVSERLRHKDRAITLWDYEHLILEEFKEVHKVKCLNHTKGTNFHAPGNVSLVLIPDTVNQNTFDMFQPRLSQAKRNKIETYINSLNSHFVTAEVVNPLYEEVSVQLGVKLHDGYDPSFYEKEVTRTIQQYLSPWAFVETAQLNFGISFHQSNLIAFLEQLPYVDYLVDVEVFHHTKAVPLGTKKINILPSNPKAILVSAKAHSITVVSSTCNPQPNTPTPVCLP